MSAGAVVRLMRTESGVTLKLLAERVGTTPRYLSAFERDLVEPMECWRRAVLQALAAAMVERSEAAA